MNYRELIKDKKKIVVKIGSSSITHESTGNINDYDVCLDTVRLGVEKTTQAIVSYAEAVL